MSDRYFQLLEHVGLDADGNPEPLQEIGLAVAVPTMKGDEVVDIPHRVTIPAIEGTRMVKTDDPRLADGLLQTGLLEEVDAPTKRQVDKQRNETQPAREAAGTRDEEVS